MTPRQKRRLMRLLLKRAYPKPKKQNLSLKALIAKLGG